MKLLIICETSDFQNFTRRATVEAIARINKDTVALCHTNIKNINKVNLNSRYTEVRCLYNLLPKSFRRIKIFNLIEHYLLRIFWSKFFSSFEFIMISSPSQAYLLRFIINQKLIFLLSDPYHLMGYNKKDIREILSNAKLILTTSKELKSNYLKKYFHFVNDEIIHYWPNTVDLEIWNYESNKKFIRTNDTTKLGFSGNFMELTDLNLLELLVSKFPECEFQIAGKINYNEESFINKLKSIFQQPNVKYLGWLKYEDLPKTIINWDVCLMIDDKSELSSYHHHNKLYQYLALGKPVVLQKNHNDHDGYSNVIFISDTFDEYLVNIQKALSKCKDDEFKHGCISIAAENSSEVRAKQFIKYLKNIL